MPIIDGKYVSEARANSMRKKRPLTSAAQSVPGTATKAVKKTANTIANIASAGARGISAGKKAMKKRIVSDAAAGKHGAAAQKATTRKRPQQVAQARPPNKKERPVTQGAPPSGTKTYGPYTVGGKTFYLDGSNQAWSRPGSK